MSEASASAIDRMRGPHDGILELIIVQPADWESDPFIVKHLREKVERYQAFLISEEFRRTYSGCRGVIVLETSHFPPDEVQQILAKEGVEVRVTQVTAVPDGVEQVRETSAGEIELVLFQRDDWESDPFLVKRLRETGAAIQSYLESDSFHQSYPGRRGVIVLETTFAPPSDVRGLLQKLSIDVRSASAPVEAPAPQVAAATQAPVAQEAAPAAPAATVAPAPAAAPAPAVSAPAAPAAAASTAAEKPLFVQRKPTRDQWEDDLESDPYDDDLPPVQRAGGASLSPMFWVSGGISVVCLIGALIAMMSGGGTPEVGSPKVVQAASISANTLPKESYATVTIKPDRRTFVLVPIQAAKSGRKEYFLLFRALEQPRLMIFARQDQSQIVSEIKFVKHPMEDDEKVPKPIWKPDLRGAGLAPETRTYTGRLEHARRRKNGPVVLVLPDNHRDLNKIYQSLGIRFAPDTMIMVVGEKPHPPSGNQSMLALVCFLGALLAGGVAFAARNQGKRDF